MLPQNGRDDLARVRGSLLPSAYSPPDKRGAAHAAPKFEAAPWDGGRMERLISGQGHPLELLGRTRVHELQITISS